MQFLKDIISGVSKAMIENVKEEPSTSKISRYFDDGPPPLEGDDEFNDDAMGEFFYSNEEFKNNNEFHY